MKDLAINIFLCCGIIASIAITIFILLAILYHVTNAWSDRVNHALLRFWYHVDIGKVVYLARPYAPPNTANYFTNDVSYSSRDQTGNRILDLSGRTIHEVHILTEAQFGKLKSYEEKYEQK